jgi:hypothetical protein
MVSGRDRPTANVYLIDDALSVAMTKGPLDREFRYSEADNVTTNVACCDYAPKAIPRLERDDSPVADVMKGAKLQPFFRWLAWTVSGSDQRSATTNLVPVGVDRKTDRRFHFHLNRARQAQRTVPFPERGLLAKVDSVERHLHHLMCPGRPVG